MATYTQLATTTVGAGGAASVTFSNISQAYTDLVLFVSGRGVSDNNAVITFNGASPTVSGRYLLGNGSAASSGTVTAMYVRLTTDGTDTANTFANNFVYITNYASSNYKSVSADTVGENNGTTALANLWAYLWQSTNAITSITITPSANLAQYTTATLYGVWSGTSETLPTAPTIGTATATGPTTATVAYTAGSDASYYVATSSPGSITKTGTTSPITVSGLSSGTSYTFTVAGVNPGGTGASSAASNSVTPNGPAFESIATYSVGAGGAASITFNSIPSSYTHLQLRFIWKDGTSGGNQPYIRFNGDSSTNYTREVMYGDGSTIGKNVAATGGYNGITAGYTYPNATNVFIGVLVDIPEYTNTSKYKNIKYIAGMDRNGSGDINYGTGIWVDTSAVSSITVVNTGGHNFLQYSHFALYGIKG